MSNPKHPRITLLVQDLKRAAHEWEAQTGRRCEGLAAPQIGVPLRVVIVRRVDDMIPPKTVVRNHKHRFDPETREPNETPYEKWMDVNPDVWQVLINPVITHSEGEQESSEGCLSCPGVVCKITRPQLVHFTYTKPNGHRAVSVMADGKKQDLFQGEGFAAACLSHELDHLAGTLIVDKSLETKTEAEILQEQHATPEPSLADSA